MIANRFPFASLAFLLLTPAACALAGEPSEPPRAVSDCPGPLAERWACAVAEVGRADGTTWIGWAIERPEAGLIMSDTGPDELGVGGSSLAKRLGEGTERGARLVAFVFAFPAGADGEAEIAGTRIRTLIGPANLGDARLVWLGESGHAESVALLASIFDRVRRVDVRTEFGPMVALHQAPEAIPVLRRIVTGEEPESVRAEALAWIGYQRDDPAARSIVLEALRRDPSRLVVDEALGALDLDGGSTPEVREVLFGLLADHPDPRVRALVAESLERLRTADVVEPLVRSATTDASVEVRMEAVDALGDSRAPGARSALERLAREASDPAVRREAADRLDD